MIRFKINGSVFEEQEGLTIIEAADRHGIHIPRFCYHPQLSIAANCRMCLVETSTSSKPLPACVTPVQEGMEIFTTSHKTQTVQKEVLEFLLINHPLDCPVCDQAGECELQDLTLAHGSDQSFFEEKKRRVSNPYLGPLVATEMNRCIHCTRCVRFSEEIAGKKEIGMFSKGEHSYIATYQDQPLESSFSGNIIDLCPVGALTSKPARYRGRSWQYQAYYSLSFHDGLRSRIMIHCYQAEIRRITSYAQSGASDYWISDRDRFGVPSEQAYPRLREKTQTEFSPSNENFYEFLQRLALSHERIDCVVHPLISYDQYRALKSILHSVALNFRVLSIGQELHAPRAKLSWEHSSEQILIVIGSFLESHFSNLYLEIRKLLCNQDEKIVYHISFVEESILAGRIEKIISSPQDYLKHLKVLVEKFKNKELQIVLCQQIYNDLSYVQELIDWIEKKNLDYYLIRELAPYDSDMVYDSWDSQGPADLVLTFQIERSDLNFHPSAQALIQQAQMIISLNSYLAQWSENLPVIQWPHVSPWEESSSYKSFWQKEKVFIEAVPLADSLKDSVNFQAIQAHLDLDDDFLCQESKEISVPEKKMQKRKELKQKDFLLVVLKNPAHTNLFIRRAVPFLQTPVVLAQKGFWLSADLGSFIKEGSISIQISESQALQATASVCSFLAPQTMIFWDCFDQPAVSVLKSHYTIENIV